MNLLYVILVWIHLIAASFWVGGMLFLSLVVVPLLKTDPNPQSAQRGFVNLARRFRTLAWGALLILVLTGAAMLGQVINFSAPLSSWPSVVITKITLVLMLVVVSLTHDRIIGPKVRILKQKGSSALSMGDKFLLRLSPIFGRLTLLVGLGVLLFAVLMARS